MEKNSTYESVIKLIDEQKNDLVDLSARQYSKFSRTGTKARRGHAAMRRDLNVFNEVGIPSVCYGSPRQRETLSGAGNRAMKIADLVQATKVYALTAIKLCGLCKS